jgi:hypothetical protein
MINDDQVNEDHAWGEGGKMNAYRILVGKPERKRQLARPRHG